MAASLRHRSGTTAAMYLRCFPFDTWGMANHEAAVHAFAWSLGFCDPHVFLDNGCLSGSELPQLARLASLVRDGYCEAVFVPGLWVFSVNDADAEAAAARLERLGGRVLEMPSPRAGRAGRQPVAGAEPRRPGPSDRGGAPAGSFAVLVG